jgi:hypothetical protein
MKMFLRLIIIVLAMLAAAQFINYYAPSWYQTVAFTAPIVGVMTYAYCMLAAICLAMTVTVFGK